MDTVKYLPRTNLSYLIISSSCAGQGRLYLAGDTLLPMAGGLNCRDLAPGSHNHCAYSAIYERLARSARLV
jgi:hypothetical protein